MHIRFEIQGMAVGRHDAGPRAILLHTSSGSSFPQRAKCIREKLRPWPFMPALPLSIRASLIAMASPRARRDDSRKGALLHRDWTAATGGGTTECASIHRGIVLELPTAVTTQEGMNAALAERVTQLTAKYPSRVAYKEFWRAKPHFPPADWNPWVEEFLDYEISGESPVQPKASVAGVFADLAEGFKRDEITERLRALRVPVLFHPSNQRLHSEPAPVVLRFLVQPDSNLGAANRGPQDSGTTHYTIVLGERGATQN